VALLCDRDFRAFGGAGIAVWGQPATPPDRGYRLTVPGRYHRPQRTQ
jgi:hypothetical protein